MSIYSWKKCFELLCETVDKYVAGIALKADPQTGGNYYSKKHLEELKEVKISDDSETISTKIKALWYPPFEGAYIMLGGKKFYLIDEKIMKDYADLM